jgi:hypothetical protein
MKKLTVLLIIAMLIASLTSAYATDLGIQVIGGPEAALTPQSLDDMQLGQVYTIDGYAKVEPVEFMMADFFAQFNKDANYANVGGNKSANEAQVFVDKVNKDFYYNWRWYEAYWNDSGVNADFAWLMMDITNLQKKGVNFMENASVKVIYQDDYEFAGWVRQVNYDYLNYGSGGRDVTRINATTARPNVVVLDPANVETIDMMYTGTYVFGATLPNSVVEDTKSPLQIIVTIDGNELTYNVRK